MSSKTLQHGQVTAVHMNQSQQNDSQQEAVELSDGPVQHFDLCPFCMASSGPPPCRMDIKHLTLRPATASACTFTDGMSVHGALKISAKSALSHYEHNVKHRKINVWTCLSVGHCCWVMMLEKQ